MFGGFIGRISPPDEIAHLWSGLASLISGAAFGLVLLGARGNPNSKYSRYWYRRSGFFVCVGLLLLFFYYWEYNANTIVYGGKRIVVGATYTAKAQEYVNQSPNLSREQVLLDFEGKVEEVWTPKSLANGRTLLIVIYSAFVFSIVFGLVFLAEGLHRSDSS
jgi:hypothetical protein